jgi:spermidine/putrescine transport system substrate-binding protein
MAKTRKHALAGATRRQVLKYSGATAAAALAAPYVNRAWAQTVELNMLAWYGHAEPDMVEEFEATHNVKFKPKYYAGGDNMLGLIAQSPPGTYDIILSDAEFVQQLNAAGYIVELDAGDYPFDDFIYDEFKQFPGHWADGKLYSVMLRFGHLGVSFNTEQISHDEAMTYGVLWNERLAGKIGHFDWHLPNLGCLSLYNGNNDPSPFDIDDQQWTKLQETTLSLKPQVGGYFDYGGTFNSLKTGEIWAMCGIGDWITGVLAKDGAPVDSVVPAEGGIQWTESYSIGADTRHRDLCVQFIQYMLSPKGQVRSANMVAYPGFCVTNGGVAALMEETPQEAERTGQVPGAPNNPVTLISEGRIHYRDIPHQQSLEDWNDFWSEYKNA